MRSRVTSKLSRHSCKASDIAPLKTGSISRRQRYFQADLATHDELLQ